MHHERIDARENVLEFTRKLALDRYLVHVSRAAHISSTSQWANMYQRSIIDPSTFWAKEANNFMWRKKVGFFSLQLDFTHGAYACRSAAVCPGSRRRPGGFMINVDVKLLEVTKILQLELVVLQWDTVVDADFNKGHIKWFEGGKLNVSTCCWRTAIVGGQVEVEAWRPWAQVNRPAASSPWTNSLGIPASRNLQITENALDRHIAAGFGDKPAVTWESDDGSHITYTFKDVVEQVNAMAQVLDAEGVKKGHTVSICMPMIPQLMFSVLACARE